jgi:putative Holliday junction resolvase
MKILGIDFGLKKIGLAIADGELAEPLAVVLNNSKVFRRIAIICLENGVERIILGKPEGTIGKKAVAFGRKLNQVTLIPITFLEEVLTTKEAIAKMVEAGSTRKRRREKEDAVAAALVLQEYLERRNSV